MNDVFTFIHLKIHIKSTETNFQGFSTALYCQRHSAKLLFVLFFRFESKLKSYGPAKLKLSKKPKIQLFKFQKFVKNRKKQNFTFLTKNTVPTLLFSTRKLSWLFFEIGLENAFLGGKNRKSRKKPKKRPFFSTKHFFSRKLVVTSFQKSYILFL